MKALVFFAVNAFCVVPVLFSLDAWTPPSFLLLASVALLAQRPDRWWALAAALGAALLLAWWVYLTNVLWTVGPNAVERSMLLALRAWALTGISAAFALGIRVSELLNESMQLAHLSARWGFALFTALNILPRLLDEQRHLKAVHRVRLGGRSSSFLVQTVTLLARAIRSAERSALSMASRGLEAPGPRSWWRPVRWTATDRVQLVTAFVVATAVLGFLVATKRFVFGFY